jgi:phospholipid/cholesterol/gamma-HCH transport system substrate-binding protein
VKSFTERNPLVIGLIAIVVIAVGTSGALILNSSTLAKLRRSYSISAVFPDTAGLRGGDRITIAGVQVGTVGGIRQQGNAVHVTLKVNHGVQIPDDSRAEIHVETLLGRKAVRLDTGNDWDHLLRAGAEIPLERTSSPTEVLDVQTDAQGALAQLDAQSLNTFIADLARVTAGKRDEVSTIIDGLNRLTAVVNARRSQVSNLIDATNTVSATLASRDQQLLSIIDNLDVVLHGLAVRRAQISDLLQQTEAAASQISGLVSANRDKLNGILAELHTDLAIIGRHQVDLAQSVAYLGAAIRGFQSIGYSGPNNTPNSWANVFTVGLGPVSADPVFGCGGAVDQALNAALGPDPLPCSQATGPVAQPASLSGVPALASLPGVRPDGATSSGPVLPTASTASTADAINALLVPFLVG